MTVNIRKMLWEMWLLFIKVWIERSSYGWPSIFGISDVQSCYFWCQIRWCFLCDCLCLNVASKRIEEDKFVSLALPLLCSIFWLCVPRFCILLDPFFTGHFKKLPGSQQLEWLVFGRKFCKKIKVVQKINTQFKNEVGN